MIDPKPAPKTPQARAPSPKAYALLGGTYAVVALAAYFFGAQGVPPFQLLGGKAAATPLARVGYALAAPTLGGDAGRWARLQSDLGRVRATLGPEEQQVLDLVVNVRGLADQGVPNLEAAAQACAALKWPRCDEPALIALAKRSRP